jgi:hypothetical protein
MVKMDQELRRQMVEMLAQLRPEQLRIFKLMYAHKNPGLDTESVVLSIPYEKLDWAFKQIETSLAGNKAEHPVVQ